jgi:hypothetical protein
MKCKLKYVGMIFFIGVFLYFIYQYHIGIYGVPSKHRETKKLVEAYINREYPNMKYTSRSVYYFKWSTYGCKITTVEKFPVTFDVEVSKNKGIWDNYYVCKVESEAKRRVLGLIKDKIPSTEPYISINADGVDGNYTSLYIRWKGEKMSLEDFVDKVLVIRQVLLQNNINLYRLSIDDEINKYTIDLEKEKGNLHFSKEEIIKNGIVVKKE